MEKNQASWACERVKSCHIMDQNSKHVPYEHQAPIRQTHWPEARFSSLASGFQILVPTGISWGFKKSSVACLQPSDILTSLLWGVK